MDNIQSLLERNFLKYKNSTISISYFGMIWELSNIINSQISSKNYDEKYSLLMDASKWILKIEKISEHKTLKKFIETLDSSIKQLEDLYENCKNENTTFNYKLACTDLIWNYEYITRTWKSKSKKIEALMIFGEKYYFEGNLKKALMSFDQSYEILINYFPMINSIKDLNKVISPPLALSFCHLLQKNYEKANFFLKKAIYFNPAFIKSDIEYLKINNILLLENPYLIKENMEKIKGISIFKNLRNEMKEYLFINKKESEHLELQIFLDLLCKEKSNALPKLENKDGQLFQYFNSSFNEAHDFFKVNSLSQTNSNALQLSTTTRIRSQINVLPEGDLKSKLKFKEFISTTSSQIIGNLTHFLPLKSKKFQTKTIENSFIGKECMNWFINNNVFPSKTEAIEFFEMMLEFGVISEINNETRYIENSLYFFKLMPVKKVIKEGNLMKKGQVKWNKRWICLYSNMISYYSNEKDDKIKNNIHFNRVKGWNVYRLKGEKRAHCLQIFTNEQIPMIFHSDDEEYISSWHQIIIETLDNYFNATPPLDIKANAGYLSLDEFIPV